MIPNVQIPEWDADGGGGGALSPITLSAGDTCLFSSDQFRMFQFKVQICPRVRSHDWTECPYVHPGEKARRRDPRKYVYSGRACPDYRKGNCMKGDTCQFAHGVFECWLHPSRYRTQLCREGIGCRRRVCFFAHTKEQLRLQVLTDSTSSASPTSVLKHSFWDSPPSSAYSLLRTRGGFLSVNEDEEEPAMERMESGRDIRARIYAKLSRENSISHVDIGWVN